MSLAVNALISFLIVLKFIYLTILSQIFIISILAVCFIYLFIFIVLLLLLLLLNQGAITIELSILLLCFCSFDLFCPLLCKKFVYCIVLSY